MGMKSEVLLFISIAIFLMGKLGAEQDRPNIIYLNADDLGVMDVGFMGSKIYHTPNLDHLASEGMIFTNAYAPAANCAPGRAACFSGNGHQEPASTQWANRSGEMLGTVC